MTPDKRTLFKTGPYPYYFRLFDRIEEVEKGGYVVHINYMGEKEDGSVKDLPVTIAEKLGYWQQILSLKELEIDGGNDLARSCVEKCEQWNRLEANDAIDDLREARAVAARLPGSRDASSRVRFIENVLGKYEVWYRGNAFKMPDLGDPPPATSPQLPQKLRGPKEMGNYYVKAVEHFQKVRPTLIDLSEVSAIPRSTWDNSLNQIHILMTIRDRVVKKMHMAKPKEKKEFWGEVLIYLEDLIEHRVSRKARAKENNVGREIDDFAMEEE